MPIDRDRPAGISSYREAKPVKKTPSGLNVARFIAREEELHQARAYTKVNAANTDRARWEEKQNLRSGSGARLQQQKQLAEEMELMNKEVQIIRAERLRKYYDACYAQWEDELRAKGLAIARRFAIHYLTMKDVLALRKLSPALQLSIQLARVTLGIAFNNLSDDYFRELLVGDPHEILNRARSIDVDNVPDAAYEIICRITEDREYNPGLAARESEGGFFLDLDTQLTQLKRDLEAAHEESRRLFPSTTFCVGVDGSRQSYMAFEVTARLRRQGVVAILHVDENQAIHTMQLPVISKDFILEEYTNHANRLRIPQHRVVLDSLAQETPTSTVASRLLDRCAKHNADFLVLGTIGKGGPAIDQLGHVPREVLRFSPIPVILIPPAPIHSIPARSFAFVVAVDNSSSSTRCLRAALKLMRPSDSLHVVHFYKKPLVGDFDKEPFTYCYDFLDRTKIQGTINILPLETGITIPESIHEYTRTHSASYLILGLNGQGFDENNGIGDAPQQIDNRVGRVTAAMLFSPRCTLCICP